MRSCVNLALFGRAIKVLLIVMLCQQGVSAAVIHGRVSWKGRPAAGDLVTLFRLNKSGTHYTAAFSSRTNTFGEYRLPLSNGTYVLLVWSNGQRVFQGLIQIAAPDDVMDIALGGPGPIVSRVYSVKAGVVHDPLLKGLRPGALGFLGSETVVVLDAGNERILRINTGTQPTRRVGILSDLGRHSLMSIQDMATLSNDLFLVANRPAGLPALLAEDRVDELGHMTGGGVWPSLGKAVRFLAVAVDSRSRTCYVSGVAQGPSTLYALHLNAGVKGQLTEVADWDNTTNPKTISPITVDSAHGVLYAADPGSRELYRVDLAHPHDLHLVKLRDSKGHRYAALPHGTPSAIALDPGNQTLYVAGGQYLWAVHLGSEPLLFEEKADRFRDLRALTVARTGNVWVGDWQTHAIYVLSPAGKVLTTYEQ
jgi:hypothetical protein